MALLDHNLLPPPTPEDFTVDVDTGGTKTRRIIPLHHVYSTTSPCVSASGSSNVMSKKVKARKLTSCSTLNPSNPTRPPLLHVYSRRATHTCSPPLNFYDSVLSRNRECDLGTEDCEIISGSHKKKRRRVGNGELVKLGVDSTSFEALNGPRLRDFRNHGAVDSNLKRTGPNLGSQRKKKRDSSEKSGNVLPNSAKSKKWIRLSFGDADPKTLIGLQCKVFWPLDADWYSGRVSGYNSETKRHSVKYDDGEAEDLMLSDEKIKFFVSPDEMEQLKLSCGISSVDCEDYDYNEMVVLAASLDDCQELEPGDIVWAKLTGHAMWPAVVVDESLIGNRKGLNRIVGRSVTVQFFGTHDFARIKVKHVISFLKGLLSRFHQKCKQPRFIRSLEEAKTYLSEQKLPRRMLQLQNDIDDDGCGSISGEEEGSMDAEEDCIKDLRILKKNTGGQKLPYVIGDLKIISVGKIVKDSEFFKAGKYIFPVGYTALRKFTSVTDPTSSTMYKMEVLRDAASKNRPLFRVTMVNGEQFNGSSPSACWNKIYKRLKRVHNISSDGSSSECGAESGNRCGTDMFGLSNPEVVRLIQGYSKSRFLSKHSTYKLTHRMDFDMPVGYRPVRVDWKDLDKCNVCHMDEEYENNLFLQCDKCRMMVHARCYGELEPMGGVLWLCNLCRPGAPDPPPVCCLCPVIGGAMKPTTDGRWAHLACAIWIPETCLSDVKRMEPIDGISRINKDRWKLLCSICNVSYGACIQCSNNSCCVSYHPLCARAAGLCLELEDEDRLHLLSFDEDEENQCIRLLSFCKRHKQPSNSRSATEDRISRMTQPCSDHTPPLNQSGCARSEPYSYFGRRGRKEPEVLAAASLKRLFVENQPYLVGGNSHHLLSSNLPSSSAHNGTEVSFDLQKLKAIHLEAPKDIHSVADKYKHMKETFRKRLAFGKSAIHGFGIFAKHPHRAGDMVIEYTGELVRPPVADRREHLIYNSLVGAGTYMFRINDERVIDATRAGSIAHLINHSCEPNCYSRVISVNGDEHIIIFAKRDIKRWEELTYDYRFFSIDERLACYCGFPRCRGVVNDTEAEEQVAKLRVPRSELVDWTGE